MSSGSPEEREEQWVREHFAHVRSFWSKPKPPHSDRLDFETFQSVTKPWQLTMAKKAALLQASTNVVEQWQRSGAILTPDQRVRIEYIIDIALSLGSMIRPEQQSHVLSARFEALSWHSPLELMSTASLDDLEAVALYVRKVTGT